MQNRRIDDAEPPDRLRRRLAKGGLAIPVVLSTLGSRPVLGQVPYICTMSGKASGNTSHPGTQVDCATGDAPSTYLAQGGTDLDIPFNSLSSEGSTLLDAIQSVVPTADPATCTTPNQTVTAPEVVPPTDPRLGGRRARQRGHIRRPTALANPESIKRSTALFTPAV